MSVQIQLRRDTTANWTSADPVLADGEPALDTTLGLIKYGDGVSAWSALPYRGLDGAPGGTVYSVDINLGSVPRDAVTTTFAHVGATTLQQVTISPAPVSATDDELEVEPVSVAAMVSAIDTIRVSICASRSGGLLSGVRRFSYMVG